MPEGSIEALIASGNLSLVESEILRQKLSGWSSFLVYLREVIGPDYRFYFEVWQPYLRRNGNTAQVNKTHTHVPGNPGYEWAQEFPDISYEQFDHSTLLKELQFRNILAELWTIQQDLQVAFDELETELSNIIPLIEDEITGL